MLFNVTAFVKLLHYLRLAHRSTLKYTILLFMSFRLIRHSILGQAMCVRAQVC